MGHEPVKQRDKHHQQFRHEIGPTTKSSMFDQENHSG